MGSGMFSRIGIGARLFIAFLGIAMLSLSSGVAGWWILRDVTSTQSRLTAQALPAVAAAQQTVDATTRILAAGQNLAAAQDESARARHEGEITSMAREIRRALADAALSRLDDASLAKLSGNAEALFHNLKEQNGLVGERLKLLQSYADRSDRTLAAAGALVDLSDTLVSNASSSASAVVASLYGLIDMVGLRAETFDALDRLIEQDIYLLDRMWELRLRSSQLALVTNRLSRAVGKAEVEALKREFSGHLRVIERRVSSIDDPIRQTQAAAQLPALRSAAGELQRSSSLFEDRTRIIAIGDELEKVAGRNRVLSQRLNTVAQAVMSDARQFAQESSAQALRAVSAGPWALLATSAVAVLISGLIVWLYVERGVVRRLQELAAAMQRLTAGDLTVEVAQGGTHELKDLAAAVTAFRDVSRRRHLLEAEREKTNEELRRHREELQDLVHERTEQLRREVRSHAEARDAAERANKAKSVFLAAMSHEIRTPMTGMLGMLRVLGDTPLATDQQAHVRTAAAAGEALLGILNSILDYSKIETDKINVEALPFSMAQTLRGVVELMEPAAREKGLGLYLQIDPAIASWLEGDAGKIRQIIFNLVSNAIKFTHRGIVSVQARAANIGGDSQSVWITVSDTGIGISEAGRDSIFEAFSQSDNSITRRYGGTGLGLSISRGLSAAMGGSLSVVSELGKGSAFTLALELPLSHAPLAEVPKNADKPRGDTPLRILIVEDDEVTADVAVRFLEGLGHICRRSPDAFGAFEIAAQFSPQIVLMDISLPGMDGIAAMRKMRALLKPHRVHIIAMSAHVFREEVEHYLASGMEAFVSKPLTPEALADAIHSVLVVRHPDAVDRAAWAEDISKLGLEQMREILALAERTLPERLAGMRRALEEKNMAGLASAAHAARSTASACGFTQLHLALTELEEAAKRADTAACQQFMLTAGTAVTEALEEAARLLRQAC